MADKIKMTAVVHPFKSARKRLEFDEGTTVKDMVLFAQPDSTKLRHAIVFINGKVIPKKIWATHRPLAGEIVEVRACPIPHGGGGGGGKDILRVVLTIAVVALALATSGAALALMGFSEATIAAGGAWVTFAGAMYVGAASTIGMLAINSLCPVSTSASTASLSSTDSTDSNTLYIEGASNSIDPFGVVPVTLGKYRQTPRQGSKPYTEMIGDNQYIRMLFVWGVGPLEIDEASIKIGDTLLSEFSDYQIEHREGYAGDAALTLFPEAISEEDFTVALTAVNDWITRTTTINADEISLDVSFSGGLVEYDANGNKGPRSVNVEIQYRKTGSGDAWSNIDTAGVKFQATCDPSWLNKTGALLNSITFTGKKTSALRYGIRWGVSERAQYDVRVRRITADTDSTLIADRTYWTALRSIKIESPIDSPVPLAVTALVIKATDQLNGVIDDFSGIVTRVCPDWDVATQTWITRATQNPASMFRFVLQGNGMAEPLDDDRIDIEALQDWHEFCEVKGFKFNQVRDYSASVWSTLRDICATGRAAPTMVDGLWSVVIDREQTAPVSIITPRNSFDFSAEKFFLNPPHGWRIQFPNEDENYATDEYRVYRDGYNDDNATKFETLDLLGVTDPDQIYKLGRWRIAQALNQPERWTFKQDMEFLTYRRGDWIKIAHDVMIVGLAQGRVKSVVTAEDSVVVSIELDEEVMMEAGKTYGVVIRTLTDPSLSVQVVTSEGTTKILVFSEEIAGIGSPAEPAINIGDIVCFGEFGEETEDATVISITPDNNLQATIIAVPYRPAIYACDTEEIPEFVTKITASDTIPTPNITSMVSDESAIVISLTGTLKERIGINFDPLNTNIFGNGSELDVQIRQDGTEESFYPAVIEEQGNGYVFIGDVRTNEVVDIRLRFKVNGRLLPGPWTTVSGYTVIGKSYPPADVKGFNVSQNGDEIVLSWSANIDIDLLGYEIRMGDTWGAATVIEKCWQGVEKRLPIFLFGNQEYLIKAIDSSGNSSLNAASATLTIDSANLIEDKGSYDLDDWLNGSLEGSEANVEDIVDESDNLVVDESDEQVESDYLPGFIIDDNIENEQVINESGEFCIDENDELIMESVNYPDLLSLKLYTDLYASEGIYISVVKDLGALMKACIRVTTNVQGNASYVLYINTSEDGLTWNGWNAYAPGEYLCRYFKIKLVVINSNVNDMVYVLDLTAFVTVQSIFEKFNSQAISMGGVNLVFTKTFITFVNVFITAAGANRRAVYASKNLTQITGIKVLDNSDADVGGTIDCLIQGY